MLAFPARMRVHGLITSTKFLANLSLTKRGSLISANEGRCLYDELCVFWSDEINRMIY